MNGKITGVRFGTVINNIDPKGAEEITVKIIPEDNGLSDENMVINAVPLMPKMFFVRPKINECVYVIFATNNDGNSQRYYIGPVISQMHRLYFEPSFQGADSLQKGGSKSLDVNPYTQEDSFGAYPSGDDIAIMGRKNCDIILKDDDIRIRAGVRLSSDDLKYQIAFNKKNPSYIKLKYHETALDGDNHSTANIVADKINLISNKSRDPFITTTDSESLLTDDELNKFLRDGYKLPYGEKLVTLLKEMIRIFKEHTHDFIAKAPNKEWIDEIESAAKEPLEEGKLLSDSVRIN